MHSLQSPCILATCYTPKGVSHSAHRGALGWRGCGRFPTTWWWVPCKRGWQRDAATLRYLIGIQVDETRWPRGAPRRNLFPFKFFQVVACAGKPPQEGAENTIQIRPCTKGSGCMVGRYGNIGRRCLPPFVAVPACSSCRRFERGR